MGLSFAGEQRDYVEEVALALQARDVDVFYDAFYDVELWGCNLVDTLDDLYSERMNAVIIFVSKDYVENPFTDVERQAALSTAIRTREKYIFPVRFDEVRLPGLPSTIAYLEVSKNTSEQLAAKICQVIGAASSLKDDNITPPRSEAASGSLSFSNAPAPAEEAAPEPDEEIVGANSDPESDGLWQAKWPTEHYQSLHSVLKVNPVQVSRAWLRVIPRGFSNGIPPISAVANLPEHECLLAPLGGGNTGYSVPCEFGFLAYRISSEEDDGTSLAHNLAAFLEKTGEIWMSDGTAFRIDFGLRWLFVDDLLTNWDRGLNNAMTCLDTLGASSHRRIIIGIEGLENSWWNLNVSSEPVRSRQPEMLHENTKHNWSVQDQADFLVTAWNKLRNAFSLRGMTAQEFDIFRVSRERFNPDNSCLPGYAQDTCKKLS